MADSSKQPAYLMETQDGTLVRVPADRLEQWQKAQAAQKKEAPQLSRSEQRLKDRIMQEIFGSRR